MNEKSNVTKSAGMDRFTKNYLIFLGVIAIAVMAWWVWSWNPRVGEINDILESDPKLSEYPYEFRVISLENGVAKISSPRSFDVPVMRVLSVLHPRLRGKEQDHPDMMAAQAELATHQKWAGKLVQDHEDVNSVHWTLDEDWLNAHGIF